MYILFVTIIIITIIKHIIVILVSFIPLFCYLYYELSMRVKLRISMLELNLKLTINTKMSIKIVLEFYVAQVSKVLEYITIFSVCFFRMKLKLFNMISEFSIDPSRTTSRLDD